MLAMVLFPRVQTQAELDRVCPGRLPDFSDYDSLPYIQAIVLEALRWNPVIPEGMSALVLVSENLAERLSSALPHCTTEDDVYEGYFIPKGSVVVGNSWYGCLCCLRTAHEVISLQGNSS